MSIISKEFRFDRTWHIRVIKSGESTVLKLVRDNGSGIFITTEDSAIHFTDVGGRVL